MNNQALCGMWCVQERSALAAHGASTLGAVLHGALQCTQRSIVLCSLCCIGTLPKCVETYNTW